MTLMIFLISFVAMCLIIWFRTEAYVEYCKIFGLDSICDYTGYEKKKEDDIRLSYLDYLLSSHYSFFIRAICCPICLSTWISIIVCILTLSFFHIPFVMVGGLTIYLVVNRLID
jgi:hypothetical protein